MAWKQDLAKLKEQLAPEKGPSGSTANAGGKTGSKQPQGQPGASQPRPGPLPLRPSPSSKSAAKPTGPVPMEDEDAVFLSAMGLRAVAPKPPPRPVSVEPQPPEATPEPPKAPETFNEALRDLKGVKPLAKGLPERAAANQEPPVPRPPKALAGRPHQAPTPPPVQPSPIPPVERTPAPPPPQLATPEPETSQAPLAPVQFQLAAGMALEVNGNLDLRGHSLGDALERLKDRLGDGRLLGWRILQVTLGADPVLHEGLLKLLASGEVPMVSRYARAPIPMGGSEAWLLYFGPLS